MVPLSQTILEAGVAQGSIMAWWGSGIVFKTPAGTQIYMDPYFTNCIPSVFGVDRDFPWPISALETRPVPLILPSDTRITSILKVCRSWPSTAVCARPLMSRVFWVG